MGNGALVLSCVLACLSLLGARACSSPNKMWQETMNQGEGVCVKAHVELTSGSKSLSLSFKLVLTCPCPVESGGCPQRCLANRTPSQAMAVRPHGWLRMHQGSRNPRPSWTVAGMGAFLEHNSYERGISFAGSLSVRGSMALSRAR